MREHVLGPLRKVALQPKLRFLLYVLYLFEISGVKKMIQNQIFPSNFARELAVKSGMTKYKQGDLYTVSNLDPEYDAKKHTWNIYEAIGYFQMMIIGGAKFDDALLAFHGIRELNDEEIFTLKIIERSTKPFLLGHLADALTVKIQNSAGADFVKAAEILINDILNSGEGGLDAKKAKGLLVKLTN